MKKKKKINYKAFAKMYRELGEYRIVEPRKGVYGLEMKSKYTNNWVPITIIVKCDTIEDYKGLIFNFRYNRIKALRQELKRPNVVYTHP